MALEAQGRGPRVWGVMEMQSVLLRLCLFRLHRAGQDALSGGIYSTVVCTGGVIGSESSLLPEGRAASIHVCPYIQKIRIWCIQGDLFSITG